MSRFRIVSDDPWAEGKIPDATSSQVSYVASLCERLDRDPPGHTLNVREASELIDELKGELGWE